jgi:hypothetical protein
MEQAQPTWTEMESICLTLEPTSGAGYCSIQLPNNEYVFVNWDGRVFKANGELADELFEMFQPTI